MNFRKKLIVPPGEKVRLDKYDPSDTLGHELDEKTQAKLQKTLKRLDDLQYLLYAGKQRALLIVLQGMDAAGKDGTIRHVMSGVNPNGVEVVAFKQPSEEELGHDFLWRAARALPARGRIAIFNRSHYEEVVAVRVHPDWLERQQLPPGPRGGRFWRERFESINAFERHASRNGTKIVKLFLHVSKHEQRRRLLARLDDPAKQWKFSAADLAERAYWHGYMAAYEAALSATSTSWAPWHVIPADRKPLMRALVAQVVLDAIAGLGLSWPKLGPEQRAANAQARARLAAERDG